VAGCPALCATVGLLGRGAVALFGRGALCSAGGRGTLFGCDALALPLVRGAGVLSVVRVGGRGTGCVLCAAVVSFGCVVAAVVGVVSLVGGRGTVLFGCGAAAVVAGRDSFAVVAGRPVGLPGRALIAGLLVTGAFRAVTTPAP
jgi:hypothetical protein